MPLTISSDPSGHSPNNVYKEIAVLKTAKDRMQRKSNFTSKCPPNKDSYQTPNYSNLVPHNQLQAIAKQQPTYVNMFRQNIKIDLLDPDQTIMTPEEVPPNAIISARTLLLGLSGQETSQIDFYAEEPSEEQVVEARQRVRAATDLVTCRRPPKHNKPLAQQMLTFDHIYDMIYMIIMTRALIDTTEQGNQLKTQPSPVIRFTGELDQEMKKQIAQQVINLIRRKPKIRPPESALGSGQKIDTRNTTYYVLTTVESIATVKLEPLLSTQSFLQPTPLTVDIKIITITNALPIYWIAKAIPDLTNSAPKKLVVEKEKSSISSTPKTADESEEDDFQDEIITEIAMLYLPSHKIDVETAQQTLQNRRFDLVRDNNVIKLKNSKLRSNLATQKFFTFSNWREFWSDAGFSLEQINISHYLLKEYKSQSPHDMSKRKESIKIYEKGKETAIEIGKGMKRSREDMANLDSGAKRKQRNRSCSSSNRSSSSCNSSSNSQQIQEDWTENGNTIIPRVNGDEDRLQNDECHRQMEKERQIEFQRKVQIKNQQQNQPQQSQIQKDPEVKENQTQRRSELKNPILPIQPDSDTKTYLNIDLNSISPLHNTPPKSPSPHPQQHSSTHTLEETLAIL
ncbi:MAG: hypothetical protein EZS28_014412 [Streblomastix strix]|uniref:Uncharacterized protein n=1 Tax=Streblomastix strix TaxID=222440 RepID=A0A5J4W6D6_9EUKA|nr:MAG: hypothetical protein EZS28_014412 [Streblomastix strix]